MPVDDTDDAHDVFEDLVVDAVREPLEEDTAEATANNMMLLRRAGDKGERVVELLQELTGR